MKDNSVYSGIVPETDNGGISEGGKNKSIGVGGNNNPSGEIAEGETAQASTIWVLGGEEIVASFCRSDVMIQIYT